MGIFEPFHSKISLYSPNGANTKTSMWYTSGGRTEKSRLGSLGGGALLLRFEESFGNPDTRFEACTALEGSRRPSLDWNRAGETKERQKVSGFGRGGTWWAVVGTGQGGGGCLTSWMRTRMGGCPSRIWLMRLTHVSPHLPNDPRSPSLNAERWDVTQTNCQKAPRRCTQMGSSPVTPQTPQVRTASCSEDLCSVLFSMWFFFLSP